MGHAGHRRRLLAARPQRSRPGGRRHRPTTGANGGRSARRSTSRRRSIRWRRRSRSTAPTASPARSSRRTSPRNIFAGQGAVIDTRRRHGPDHRARAASSSSSWARPAPTTPADRAPRRMSCSATRCARRPSCSASPRRFRSTASARAEPAEPIVRDPNESRLIGPDARRSEDVLLTRFDAAALVPVLQGRQYLLVHVERASDILQVLALKREFPALKLVLVGATEGWTVADRIAAAGRPGDRLGGQRSAGQRSRARRDPVERRPDARRRGQGVDRHDRRQ